MIKSKFFNIFLIFCFFCFSTKVSTAQEEHDYENISSGTCVNKDGFFFTQQGMVKLATNVEQKLKLQNIDKQKDIDLLAVELQKCSASKTSELRIQKEMYENQLIIKQKTIDAYQTNSYFNNGKIVATLMMGIITGAVIAAGVIYNLNGK